MKRLIVLAIILLFSVSALVEALEFKKVTVCAGTDYHSHKEWIREYGPLKSINETVNKVLIENPEWDFSHFEIQYSAAEDTDRRDDIIISKDGKTFTVTHHPGSGSTGFSIEYHDIWLKKEVK